MNGSTKLGAQLATLKQQLITATQKHRWTAEEIETLLNEYRAWSSKNTEKFSLKQFINSLRSKLPFFQTLDDKQFYNRVSRTLYRSLVKHGIAWKHAGKTRLKPQEVKPELATILEKLEGLGVGIAKDGAVLLILTTKYYTDTSDEGYFVPTIPHAISHLQRVLSGNAELKEHLGNEIQEVISLLQRFVEFWKQQPEKETLFNPIIKESLEDYKIEQDSTTPHLYTLTKPDGTEYVCDTKAHTCTCPAGQSGRSCKHLIKLIYL